MRTDPPVLSVAEGKFRTCGDKLNIRNAPEAELREAVHAVEAIILTAGTEQTGWGSLRLKALRELGCYLHSTPRLRGRPKKESTADSLPSLVDLGITDRHVAADALKVASVPVQDFDDFLSSTDEPSFRGLFRFSEVRRENRSLDEMTQKIEAEMASHATQKREPPVGPVKRATAAARTIDLIFHPATDSVERSNGIDALLRLDPSMGYRIKAALMRPRSEPEVTTSHSFVPLSEWRDRVAERDAIISEYRKIIWDLTRKLAKAEAELAVMKAVKSGLRMPAAA
jgi:hypothetical protein